MERNNALYYTPSPQLKSASIHQPVFGIEKASESGRDESVTLKKHSAEQTALDFRPASLDRPAQFQPGAGLRAYRPR